MHLFSLKLRKSLEDRTFTLRGVLGFLNAVERTRVLLGKLRLAAVLQWAAFHEWPEELATDAPLHGQGPVLLSCPLPRAPGGESRQQGPLPGLCLSSVVSSAWEGFWGHVHPRCPCWIRLGLKSQLC